MILAQKKQTQFEANRRPMAGNLNQIGNRCGMIESKADLKGCDLKKQSQFALGRNGHKVLFERIL